MKQEEIERMEVYYKQIQKLVHGLQVPTIHSFITIVFRMGLQSYLKIATTWMKRSTLQQHKEATMLCEGMTIAKARSALSIPHNIKQAILTKIQNNIGKIDRHCIIYGMTNHNVKTCQKKKKNKPWWQPQRSHNQIKKHKRHLHMHVTYVV